MKFKVKQAFFPATLADVETLQYISVKTYRDTFAVDNDPVELELYFSTAFSKESWTRQLKDPDYHIGLLYIDGGVSGYYALRNKPPEQCISGHRPIELERIYVDESFIGLGFGKAMMDHCVEKAREMGGDVIWLGVWEKNPTAKRFYEKAGFVEVGRHDYWIGNDCQNDLLMQKTL